MLKSIAAFAIACIPTPSLARPPLPPRTVICSFNGVQESCKKSFDTDGTNIITWPGGPTNTYECGRYQAGKGVVGSAGKTYDAACYETQSGTVYKTINGRTFIGD